MLEGAPPCVKGRGAACPAASSRADMGLLAARRSVVLVPILLTACFIVDSSQPDAARPTIALRAEVLDKYVHRGMPQNRNGVLQGTMDVSLPVENGDTLTLGAFANMDLSGSTGAAWFPGGHAGHISEFDLTGTYAHAFENGLALAGGAQTYIPPFGESFPNGPREQTTELFVHAQKEVLGALPMLQLRHDVDQANGTYVRMAVTEEFPFSDVLKLRLGAHLGWSSQSQSFWNYGVRANGWADLQGDAVIEYAYDVRTTIGAGLHASTIVDSGLRDWFDLIGIESENLWVGAFMAWRF
jgi:hypothetical protein